MGSVTVAMCSLTFSLSALLVAASLTACATYREELNRGQRMYEENRYENALAIWRLLDDDSDSLSPSDQARYAYFRGMTDYRLGFRADARHWLAIAKAREDAQPGRLRADWKGRLDQSLSDLNQEAYGVVPPPRASDAAVGTLLSASDAGSPSAGLPRAVAPEGGFGECRADADCRTGEVCDGKSCQPL